MLEIKTMVKVSSSTYGGINGKGRIISISLNYAGTFGTDRESLVYLVKHSDGSVYNYPEKYVTELKTQTLFAYLDSTEEVHWSTKQYSDKELNSFGFKKAFEYNKTIELE